jgi:hypothetical protein
MESPSTQSDRTLPWHNSFCRDYCCGLCGVHSCNAVSMECANLAKRMCAFPMDQTAPFLSYIQYSIKEQAVEPYFDGGVFISLGNVGTTAPPSKLEVDTTAQQNYGNTSTYVNFVRNEPANGWWMPKEAEHVPYYRVSGAHRNFPFDSAVISFDTTFEPALKLRFLMIRNFNPSFYIPCETANATTDLNGKIHIRFEMRRNPLVQLMSVVLLIAAALFVLIIPVSVKLETLPTAVASFFFSVWSIRGILSSEMKTFPTILDLVILALCVVLLVAIGVRVLVHFIKRSRLHNRDSREQLRA